VRLFNFLLYPFALLYGLIVCARNKLYDWGVLKSVRFDLPVISVGNLSMGGTGKTPHVEYLVKLLMADYKVATLSRGYKRNTNGYIEARMDSATDEVGDEAVQKKQKFREVAVVVDEKRVRGIKKLVIDHPQTEAIILDDAFQHRSVKPGLNILLTDFHKLYPEDHPIPMGSLREFRSGARRADMIVVTKTPNTLSPITARRIASLIKPRDHQKLYFSYIKYGQITPVPGLKNIPDLAKSVNNILVFAGIANMYPLVDHVKKMANQVEILRFGDHHKYTTSDLSKIKETFDNIFAKNKIIITTEKDAMRLFFPKIPNILNDLPVFYIPIEIKIHRDYRTGFNDQIINYVKENSGNR
jgi:tetraacyldisaccharide 4'-kinase